MQTTLNKIKLHDPCEDGWKKLLNYLGKTEADDEPLELRTILESNGVEDTIWAFRAVDGKDKEIRLFSADCAELVLPIYEKLYPNDDLPRKAIQAARDYANGLIGQEELNRASAAAIAVARAAASTATRAAARYSGMDAERAAAWAAARDAAIDVSIDVAWVTASSAEWAAARNVGSAQRAATKAENKQLLLKYI